MQTTSETDFILVGSRTEGGTVYVCQPGDERNAWLAYDVQAGGELANARVVFGRETDTNWRGLPVLA